MSQGQHKGPQTQAQMADDFEREMNEELTQRMDDMASQPAQLSSAAPKTTADGAAGIGGQQFYDEEYFDSDEDEEGAWE